ncbi:MAG: hypothetical protein KUG72_09690 [Pseudomonadales bacterium]|nr:hypothetical protein [Pseudomonadales bacterium]
MADERKKIATGDRVYIYLAAPYKQVGFVCDVLATHYNLEEIIDHVRPYEKVEGRKDGPSKPFMKLSVTQNISIDEHCPLSLNNLKQNGLNGMLMGARKLENNPELFRYISDSLS